MEQKGEFVQAYLINGVCTFWFSSHTILRDCAYVLLEPTSVHFWLWCLL